MQIDVVPPLTDDDCELLEEELLQIAHDLKIAGIDIAGVEVKGAQRIGSLEIFYEDEAKPDDKPLAALAARILDTFRARVARPQRASEDLRALLRHRGTITLKLAP